MSSTRELATQAVTPFVGALLSKAVIRCAEDLLVRQGSSAEAASAAQYYAALAPGLKLFLSDEARRKECERSLQRALGLDAAAAPAPAPALTKVSAAAASVASAAAAVAAAFSAPTPTAASEDVEIRQESDLLTARRTCRAYAQQLSFSGSEIVMLTTVVSELARNILQYASAGSISLRKILSPRPGLEIEAVDAGPGIADVSLVMSESYKSKTGMGRGLKGAKAIMNDFSLTSRPGEGTRILARKFVGGA